MVKASIFGGLLILVLLLITNMGSDEPTSRTADLRVSVDVRDDLDRANVLSAIDDFARRRHLLLSDASKAASDTLSRPTVVRFYEDQYRAVIFVTDRLERNTLLIGVHNGTAGPNSEGLGDALLEHLKRGLQDSELIIDFQE